MKAAVIHKSGGPEVLKLEDLPIPIAKTGEVLVRVRAFGLNRSELFTRQGHSPSVEFPRILGIEAVGEVVAAPGTELKEGTAVATIMGGMGRQFNGSYAEFTCVPASQVKVLPSNRLTWEALGALPEMLQTAWGSLFSALRLKPDERLLIRGGTTSIGLMAAAIAKKHGAFVAVTTRQPGRVTMLQENGADLVFIDDGAVAGQIKQQGLQLFNKVLELVGTGTLTDSLRCAAWQGSVCMTGMVGNEWTFEKFSPMDIVPHTVNLTIYSGGVEDFMATPYEELIPQVEAGILKVRLGKTFHLQEIVEAHRCLEAGSAGGKIVILTT
ncbi:zinc-binding alcohol dehydrogenase family protein [Aspergillus vadensis CBS 113365]|uniref:Alcohol dehydrogenase zinc-binding domain protein n=1 Tax=Aspergillus vadensis (strain CBS 113365 / IMI 142717 / IBT 24658) TaxID=1448311 RepID=A0A319B9D5_ASPVC|nr:alcohol dehydrogenase zinc-binding domain protein [Aspergillus vadensis CBS 113365]PYH69526.1 alcohol dehydrogenase zinc-binding domain protein [Aspergillus vadensis CBS 113365]